MMRSLLLLLLTVSALFCKAQTNKTDTILNMLEYGMPDLNGDRTAAPIARKYGFRYYAVGDCSVTKELKDSVAQENERVRKILEQRLGSDWEKAYHKELDSIWKLQAQVRALIKKGLEKGRNELYYIIDADDRPYIFDVSGLGYDIINGVPTSGMYSFTVDLATNTVIKNCETIIEETDHGIIKK